MIFLTCVGLRSLKDTKMEGLVMSRENCDQIHVHCKKFEFCNVGVSELRKPQGGVLELRSLLLVK